MKTLQTIIIGLFLTACASPKPTTSLPVVTLPTATLLGTHPVSSATPSTLLAPANQAEAIAAIRAFMGQPDLALTFVDTIHMINSPNGDLQVWRYSDTQQRTYLVETQTNRLVEVDPAGPHPQEPTAPATFSPQDLQTRAEDIAKQAIPEFATIKDSLYFESGTKDNVVYFFRWQDIASAHSGINHPFLQIALSTSGAIASYYDTLYLR